MPDCPCCYGAGGGDEPPLECLACNGTGEVPDYDNPPETQDDAFDDWDTVHATWSPY